MTLQSCSSSANDGALGSPSCSTSSSSTEVINLPLGNHGEINISNDDHQLLNIVNDLPAGPGPIIISSEGAKVGPEYNFTFHSIEGNTKIQISNYNNPPEATPVQDDDSQKDAPPGPQPPSYPARKPTTGFGLIRRNFKPLMIVITAVTLACAVALIVLRFVGGGSDGKPIFTTTTEETPTTNQTPFARYLFSRDSWGARSSSTPLPPLQIPVKLMVVKHTNTKSCHAVASCFTAMQDLQNSDVGEHGLPDIRYNFVVGGDGNIYEGRGWQVQNEQRNDSIDLAFLGNFNEEVPSSFLATTGPWMIVKGIAQGYLDWGALKVVAHNQTADTDSPGEHLYEKIITWQYYSNETFE